MSEKEVAVLKCPEEESRDEKGGKSGAAFVQRDGGWGWVVCATTFWANGTLFGLHKSFGVLYVDLLKQYGHKNKETIAFRTALIGSCCIGMMLLCGVFSGAVSNSLGLRKTACLGVLLATGGLLASSFVQTLELLYLTYSVCVGIGASMIYTTHTLIPVHYFKKRFGLANGISLLGGSIFSSFMPIVVGESIRTVGFRWTLRILAGYVSFLFLCVITWKEQIPKEKSTCCNSFLDRFCLLRTNSPLKNRQFVMYIVCAGLVYSALFVPFVHIVNYAKIVIPESRGELLILVAGISSAVSRVATGKLSDSGIIQRLTLYPCAAVLMALACSMLPFATHFASLAVLCVIFGLTEGCVLCLHVPITIDLVGLQGVSAAVGILFTVAAVPQTLGPSIAGWLYDTTGTYKLSFFLCATPLLLSACLFFLVRKLGKHSAKEVVLSDMETEKPMLKMRDMTENGEAKDMTL